MNSGGILALLLGALALAVLGSISLQESGTPDLDDFCAEMSEQATREDLRVWVSNKDITLLDEVLACLVFPDGQK